MLRGWEWPILGPIKKMCKGFDALCAFVFSFAWAIVWGFPISCPLSLIFDRGYLHVGSPGFITMMIAAFPIALIGLGCVAFGWFVIMSKGIPALIRSIPKLCKGLLMFVPRRHLNA